ncbi:Phenylacetate-coenzyme A ligase [compost metagenome]
MTKTHIWQGEWIDDATLEARIATLGQTVETTLANACPLEIVLSALDRLSNELAVQGEAYRKLRAYAEEAQVPEHDFEGGVAAIREFTAKPNVMQKLMRELGSLDPFNPSRISYAGTIFESWAPLGLLVHVTPSNVFAVAAMALVEGMLSGNLNLVKTSGSDTLFAQHFAEVLGACDPTGRVKELMIVARISSRRDDLLKTLFQEADGVSAWGNEESINAVKAMVPSGTRFIDWGHKLSFAYLSADKLDDAASLSAVAREVCLIEQQACSSPQVLYVETDDFQVLRSVAKRLAEQLAEISPGFPLATPSLQEQAEITTTTQLVNLESCLGGAELIEAPDGSWRLFVEAKSGLRASPLYRSLWVKPLLRAEIVATLRPLRKYLQTVGLACDLGSLAPLSEAFIRAGALRITQLGHMVGNNYVGEPHDGVYPLQRFTRRVTFDPGEACGRITHFAEIAPKPETLPAPRTPVMTKEDFLRYQPKREDEQLFFSSGGSSGEPKVSVFTYDDYQVQMRSAAEGLFAAGLDPTRDRCANLFAAGHMYGGFLSFFSILEALQAPQVPSGLHGNFPEIVDNIMRQKVNVLIGAPSWLMEFFEAERDALLAYGGIEKIFYGGEHFSEAQRKTLMETFGIKLIRSATYGSNDAGPMGFQCEHAEGAVFHLNTRLQILEILDPEEDRPVQEGESGRLVLTSRHRKAMKLDRYEIGDLGRWVPGACPCGRTSPRFELQGRCGDVFRPGATPFFNYNKFVNLLSQHLDYAGHVQIEYGHKVEAKSGLLLKLDRSVALDAKQVSELLVSQYKELHHSTVETGTLHFEVKLVEPKDFVFVPRSGKIKHLIARTNA